MKRCKYMLLGLFVSTLMLLGIGNFGIYANSVHSVVPQTEQTDYGQLQTAIPAFPPIQIIELTVQAGSESCTTRNHSHDFSIYSRNENEQLSATVIRFIRHFRHIKQGLPISEIIFPFQYFW